MLSGGFNYYLCSWCYNHYSSSFFFPFIKVSKCEESPFYFFSLRGKGEVFSPPAKATTAHPWGEDPPPCLWEPWDLPLTSGMILGVRDSDSVSRGRVVLTAHVKIPAATESPQRLESLPPQRKLCSLFVSLSPSSRRLNKSLGTETIISLYLMLTVSKRWITK